jgi:AcrR family transcriptional regulator
LLTTLTLQIHVSGVNMRIVKSSDRPIRERYHHGDLRNALVDKAAELVRTHGPEGFSLREAAREVGVSPAAAYRHFPDKAALLAALAIEGHARLATAMERAVARLPSGMDGKARAIAALGAIGETYVEFAVKNPSHFRVMFGPCLAEEGFAPGCAPSGRDAFQILVDALDELVAAGVLPRESRAGAEIVAWSGVHGLAGLLVEGALPLAGREREVAIATVLRALLAGVGADPALLPPAPQALDADPRGKRAPPVKARRA